MSDNTNLANVSVTSAMEFDSLEPVEVPVRLGSKSYVLREPSEDIACKYRNALLKATKLGSDGKPTSLEGLADIEPQLVSWCLFEVTNPGGDDQAKLVKPVPVSVIRGWRGQIVQSLFERVRAVGGLDEKETRETLEKRLRDTQEKLSKLDQDEGKAQGSSGSDGEGSDPTSV